MLKDLCPDARFVHIMRDPRDYGLSMRKTWGKSVVRAAERWRRDVEKARRSGLGLGGDYIEVTYERLVSDPASTLGVVCTFLGVEMVDQMMNTSRSTENLGDARGRSDILATNFGKYRHGLRPAEVLRIEQITHPVMAELGYVFDHDVEFRPLSRPSRLAAAIGDVCAVIRFHAKTRGLLGGVRYQARSYAQGARRSG
jgi:hypothetical protein